MILKAKILQSLLALALDFFMKRIRIGRKKEPETTKKPEVKK